MQRQREALGPGPELADGLRLPPLNLSALRKGAAAALPYEPSCPVPRPGIALREGEQP